jgi:hypothetical protein
MRFYSDSPNVLRSRLIAGAILLSGVLWSLEGLAVGDDRIVELLLAIGLSHGVWRLFGRKRSASDPAAEVSQ